MAAVCLQVDMYITLEFFVFQIREWVQKQKGKFLKIRPEDEEYVKQRTAEMAEKVAMAAKQTSGEAGGNIGKS